MHACVRATPGAPWRRRCRFHASIHRPCGHARARRGACTLRSIRLAADAFDPLLHAAMWDGCDRVLWLWLWLCPCACACACACSCAYRAHRRRWRFPRSLAWRGHRPWPRYGSSGSQRKISDRDTAVKMERGLLCPHRKSSAFAPKQTESLLKVGIGIIMSTCEAANTKRRPHGCCGDASARTVWWPRSRKSRVFVFKEHFKSPHVTFLCPFASSPLNLFAHTAEDFLTAQVIFGSLSRARKTQRRALLCPARVIPASVTEPRPVTSRRVVVWCF